MAHAPSDTPPCRDDFGRCTLDTDGDDNCMICAGPYWTLVRRERERSNEN